MKTDSFEFYLSKSLNKIKLFFPFMFFCYMPLIGQQQSLSIFIDCQMRCDFNFIKQEINIVDYMNNRQEADIYVLATQQTTGAGGREVQLIFIGENKFKSMTDTLSFFTDPNATEAIERDQLINTLKKGLLQFLVQTPMINHIQYSIKEKEIENHQEEKETIDPWNYWVLSLGGNLNMEAEESFKSTRISGRFNATRITDKQKFQFQFRSNYETSKFKLSDGEEVSRFQRRYNSSVVYVLSLNSHWSAGTVGNAGSSTFGNTDFSASMKPTLEYNIFPYSKANTQRFSFRYAIGPEYYNYTDTTIYQKSRETRIRHNIDIEFIQTQKWGNIEIEIRGAQYLHQLNLNSIEFNPEIELAIFRGLSLDLGGEISFVSDRINIAQSDISDEDILLQIRQRDTNFTYFIYTGINYRFGSKYNNFVNQRF